MPFNGSLKPENVFKQLVVVNLFNFIQKIEILDEKKKKNVLYSVGYVLYHWKPKTYDLLCYYIDKGVSKQNIICNKPHNTMNHYVFMMPGMKMVDISTFENPQILVRGSNHLLIGRFYLNLLCQVNYR